MKNIILVDSEEDMDKVRKLIQEHNYSPITLDFDSKIKLKNIPFKSIEDYMSKDSHIKALHWLKDWSDKKIYENKSFKELFTYKEIPLWWFIDFWLYYHAIHKDSLYEISLYLDAIKNIVEKENPEKIVLSENNPLLVKIVKIVAKKTKVGIIKGNKIKQDNSFKIEKLKEKKFLARKIFSSFVNQKVNQKDILFFTYSFNWENNKDRFLGDISNNLKQNTTKYIDIDYEPNLGILGTINRRNTHFPFEKFFTSKIAASLKTQKKHFEKQWTNLEKSESFKKSFDFDGTNIYPLLKDKLKFAITTRFVEAIKYIETANNLLTKTKPKSIALTDETSMYGRSIITAARQNKIKSIGVTHGMINETCFEYIHKKNETNINKPESCPIPDHTLAFGEYTKDILTKIGNYPKETIEIIGQPRYDFINDSKILLRNNKEQIFNSLNLDKDKKLVVFFSECTTSIETGDFPQSVFKAIKTLKDEKINFVIKLHPREHSLHWKFYENLAKKIGIEVKIIKEINTFELINACDLGIVMHSNTGLETIMLKKPLLVVNVTNKEDLFPYVKKGAALGAYKESEIPIKMKQALFDKKTKENLLKNREKFVNYMLFKLDGKSSERAKEFIEKITSI
jgi:hypothetical protein